MGSLLPKLKSCSALEVTAINKGMQKNYLLKSFGLRTTGNTLFKKCLMEIEYANYIQ